MTRLEYARCLVCRLGIVEVLEEASRCRSLRYGSKVAA